MGQRIAHDDLSLLRCVECGQGLEETPCGGCDWSNFGAGPVADCCLQCVRCKTRFPITADGIPVLWTAELRECMVANAPSATPLSANATPLSANVSVYNHVSDDYARYWRKETRNARRMRNAVLQALGLQHLGQVNRQLRHLDVGCGPGHVLQWLDDIPARQYALDVSLANLRNVKSRTRAFVVLGSADCLPFRDGAFDLVTEASVLHHIEAWDKAVSEFARVCAEGGGLIIDCEPSRESKRWSRMAVGLFELRWYPYKWLSYVSARKFWFRDTKTARLTFEAAEIHNKPNTGLPLPELALMLEKLDLVVRAVRSPDEHLDPKGRLPWQEMLLHALSGHNPLNPEYGWFTVIARRPERLPVPAQALTAADRADNL